MFARLYFRELQLVDGYLGNHGPIITLASYPNHPTNQIAERKYSVLLKVTEWTLAVTIVAIQCNITATEE